MTNLTVKQLTALLSTCDPDARIILRVEAYVNDEFTFVHGDTQFDLADNGNTVTISSVER